MDPADPTSALGRAPWARSSTFREKRELHLVLIWSSDSPERLGQAAIVAERSILGRGPGTGECPRVEFMEQRPGSLRATGALSSSNISRAQLSLSPENQCLLVENIGRCGLLHNGRDVKSAKFYPGDTLSLKDTAVFVIEKRCVFWPEHWREPKVFEFGSPDQCGIVGESELAWRLRASTRRAAQGEAHVLVTGATGAGKELVGRAIHLLSSRCRGPLVSRNAATFPATLVDVELFGCERNFPNSGVPARPGLIAEAHHGTLLLDEIGELPEAQQTHLLRVLDSQGEYQALGDARPRYSDFRMVGLTNRRLEELRPDFRARFAVHIELPALRERSSDIALLMRFLWGKLLAEEPSLSDRFSSLHDAKKPWEPLVEPRLTEGLARHCFIGNTRELERLLRLAIGASFDGFVALSSQVERELNVVEKESQEKEVTSTAIRAALAANSGSPTKAAAALGLNNRHVLYRLMKKHKVDVALA